MSLLFTVWLSVPVRCESLQIIVQRKFGNAQIAADFRTGFGNQHRALLIQIADDLLFLFFGHLFRRFADLLRAFFYQVIQQFVHIVGEKLAADLLFAGRTHGRASPPTACAAS